MTDKFFELVETELNTLEEEYNDFLLDFIEENYEDDMSALCEDFDLTEEEARELLEGLRKHVDSSGNVTKKRSKSYRSRHAAKTTGMSKAQLRLRARKSAKTRKRNPTGLKKALKKRSKAMKRRKKMGL